MKKIIFLIFILALVLRIFKLGSYPVGLHIDEIKVGWNALSILLTSKDDQGHYFPISYNSFGDYRPTGIFYLTIPSVLFFGRDIFAIRFSGALFGALMVFPVYQLLMLLSKNKKLAILGALLMAISPWGIEVSRATSESMISVFFGLYAMIFYIKLIKERKIRFAIWSFIFLIVSSLLYHSIRFLAPLFYLTLIIYFWKDIKPKIKTVVLVCLAFSIFVTLFFTTLSGSIGRLDQVSVFSNSDVIYEINRIRSDNLSANIFTRAFDNKYVIYTRHILQSYGSYFSYNFLFGNGALPYRYVSPGTGLLNFIELFFLLAGIVALIRREHGYLSGILLLLSPLPAALTVEDSPNLQRALFMLPFLILIEAYGLYSILKIASKYTGYASKFIFILILINSSFFIYTYFVHSDSHTPYIDHYSIDNGTRRDVGALELATKINLLKNKYDKIIITNYPDSIYPYYAFFNGINPKDFNNNFINNTSERVYGNIIFSFTKCPSDSAFSKYKDRNILVIDNWECDYKSQIKGGLAAKVVDKINRPDGSEVYIFLERN